MIEAELFDLIDPVLDELQARPEDGEEFASPPLDILRYYFRPVRLSRIPFFGRSTSVVAVLRQPVDLGISTNGYRTLLTRVAMAANGRFPPWRSGLSLGLTLIILTSEPVQPDDEATLKTAFIGLSRMRSVPLGLIRLNLGQEAMAVTLAGAPDGLFPEPEQLATKLAEHFKRYLPLWEG